MKKQQYIAAVACLVAGAIGFASVYATEKNQEKRNDSDYAIQQESTEQLSAAPVYLSNMVCILMPNPQMLRFFCLDTLSMMNLSS